MDESQSQQDSSPFNSNPVHTGRKVVHLHRRPTQPYYQQHASSNNNLTGQFPDEQICLARVPIEDVYAISATYDDFNKPYVDVFFVCERESQWCCGIDCCQMNWTFLFAIGIVAAVVVVAFLQVCFRGLVNKVQMRRALKRLHLVRGKRRVIIRANAQRRKETSASAGQQAMFFEQSRGRERRNSRCPSYSGSPSTPKRPPPQIIVTRSSCSIVINP